MLHQFSRCLLYTSDAADEEDSVDLGGVEAGSGIQRFDIISSHGGSVLSLSSRSIGND